MNCTATVCSLHTGEKQNAPEHGSINDYLLQLELVQHAAESVFLISTSAEKINILLLIKKWGYLVTWVEAYLYIINLVAFYKEVDG